MPPKLPAQQGFRKFANYFCANRLRGSIGSRKRELHVRRDPMDNLLSELGEARSAGVFQETTARTAFPWQARQSSVGLRGLRWLRIAVPLAAAATLAFAFV